MVFDGWMRVGGNEIFNSPRAEGITRSIDCAVSWIRGDSCDTLQDAIGDTPYSAANIATAPWYDPDAPELSSRVLGVYGMGFKSVKDSTRQVQVTEGIDDGGVIGTTRKGVRLVRVRISVITIGDDAMEYARTWLEAALDPGACGQHGEECGSTDVEYLTACPPPRPTVMVDDVTSPVSDAEYAVLVDPLRRYLHEVAVTSGPTLIEEFSRDRDGGKIVGQTLEFTLTAGRPWVYGVTKDVDLPSTTPSVIEDIAYNLERTPSMTVPDTVIAQSTNYSTNPSVETDATGWATSVNAPVTAGMVASARSTEIAAVGLASFKATFTASAAGAAGGWFACEQTVALGFSTVRERFSLNMWATVAILTGSPTVTGITIEAIWKNAGGSALGTTTLGTLPIAGGVLNVTKVLPPAGSTQVTVRARCNLGAFASGNVVALFADALSVSMP